MKQTIANMRRQPLLTALTIAGTALAICLIMIVMMTREVQLVDYGYEPYRSRTLYAEKSHIIQPNNCHSYSGLDLKCHNGIFLRLKIPETVTLFSAYTELKEVEVPGRENVLVRVRAIDANYCKVFPLRFVEGRPFTEEECESNMPIALLTRSAARKIFGSGTDPVGRTMLLSNHECRVTGIVEDVSPMLRSAYSEMWVPVGHNESVAHPLDATLYPKSSLCAAVVAKSAADFPAIRREVERNLAAFNKTIAPDTLDIGTQPDTQEVFIKREMADRDPDMKAIHLRYLLIFAILLIVPAINIASMTQSRLRQREEEIGVRRAFGARRSTILLLTMKESLLQTLAAGLLGLLLCFVLCFAAGNYIFSTDDYIFEAGVDNKLDIGILFSSEIYAWALLFCLVLNVLSSTIPAWRASRKDIVEALK